MKHLTPVSSTFFLGFFLPTVVEILISVLTVIVFADAKNFQLIAHIYCIHQLKHCCLKEYKGLPIATME